MKMLKQTIKRMVVTGAAVMVMMSFSAPAAMAIGDVNSGANTGNPSSIS